MNYIDIIISIPLLWAAYNGLRKGLILEIISICALVAAVYGSIHFSHYVGEILKSKFDFSYVQIISFSITFAIILIGLFWFARILETLIKAVALGIVNKILGCIFGLIKMAFIVSCFIYIINILDLKFIKEKTNTSILYKPVSSVAVTLFPMLKDNLNRINLSKIQSEKQ